MIWACSAQQSQITVNYEKPHFKYFKVFKIIKIVDYAHLQEIIWFKINEFEWDCRVCSVTWKRIIIKVDEVEVEWNSRVCTYLHISQEIIINVDMFESEKW